MFDYKLNGVSVSLVLKTKSKSDEKKSLCWQVIYKRSVYRIYTGFYLSKSEWNDFSTKRLRKDKEMRDTLTNYFEKTLKPTINELCEMNVFSLDALKNRLKRTEITTVNQAFDAKIERLRAAGRIGNSTIYSTVLHSFEEYAGKNVPFGKITVSFLNSYEQYLIDNNVKTATISIYMRTLRAVINNEGDPYLTGVAYPFGRGKYVPKTSKGVKVALTLKQVHAIENFECRDMLTELCRDMWLFSFYASGMNFTDILRLKYSDIVIGELTFVRYKTRNTRNDETYLHIPILEPMKRIIAKHGNKQRNGYIFPFLNNATNETERRKIISNLSNDCNKRIKAIYRELKNDDDTLMIPNYDLVNNYTARHSYATILNKMGVPESYISQQLGHSNRSVTQGYFGEYDRDERFKYNSLLLGDKPEKTVFMNVI